MGLNCYAAWIEQDC
jgi:hypothetical protein